MPTTVQADRESVKQRNLLDWTKKPGKVDGMATDPGGNSSETTTNEQARLYMFRCAKRLADRAEDLLMVSSADHESAARLTLAAAAAFTAASLPAVASEAEPWVVVDPEDGTYYSNKETWERDAAQVAEYTENGARAAVRHLTHMPENVGDLDVQPVACPLSQAAAIARGGK